MIIEFDEGWELHIRIRDRATGKQKNQPRYSIRHTHAHKRTLREGNEWLCKDIPFLLNLLGNGKRYCCRQCDDMMPEEMEGAMLMTTWSMKDAD
jgi:hypothetical protein